MSKQNKKDKQKPDWKKRRRKKRVNNTILIIAIVVLVIALARLVPIFINYKESEDTYRDISTEHVKLNDDTQLEPWMEVDIDFDSLKAINMDVIAWIRFDDLDAINIDYPIMYSEEPNKYLHANLYNEYFYAGSIFLEENNSPDFSDYYNIVYGHNMRNGTMFGTLRKYRDDDDFYGNNKYFTIYTPEAAYRYEIFAYENVAENDRIFTVGYQPDEEYQGFIDYMVSSSMRDTGIRPTNADKITTLSTCTSAGSDYRFVVNAVCVDVYYY